MNEFMFQQPHWLWLLLVVGALAFFVVKAQRKLIQIRTEMGSVPKRTDVVAWAGLVASVLVILAVARPVSDPKPSPVYREGRDVIFVLDVSRSMLAQDMLPSRLELAKLAVNDCLEFLPGGRVGLVLFAGSASIRCPLTEDRAFLQSALADAGPGSVSYGSTFLHPAVEKVVDRLLSKKRFGFQDVIFLTDGGDHSEESIAKCTELLAGSGARVLMVGFGDSSIGARIPIFDGEKTSYLQEEGREVRVKQEQGVLRELASRSGGVYLDASKGIFHLGSAYQSLSVDLDRVASDGQLQMKYKERYVWFLAAALCVLLFGAGAGRMHHRVNLVLLALLLCSNVRAQESTTPAWLESLENAATDSARVTILVRAASDAVKASDFSTASDCYSQALAFAGSENEQRALAYAGAQAMGRAAFGMLGEDPYVAASMAEQAELALLTQRRLHPSDSSVLRDLCCIYDIQSQAAGLIAAQEASDEQMQKKMEELLQKLQALADQQREVVKACRPMRPEKREPAPAAELVAALCQATQQSEQPILTELNPIRNEFGSMAEMMKQLLSDQLGIDGAEDNEFGKATGLLAEAESALKTAIQRYADGLGLPGLGSSEVALRKMDETLNLFANQQSSEGDESEESEDEDGEYEMSDEWGEGEMESMPMESAAGRMDLESRQLPEPQFSAEDILQEEAANNRAREQKGSGGDSDVKKDW